MSVYEGLSLLVSTLGTLFTVYIGLRQLRQAAPATQPPMPAPAPASAPYPYPSQGGPRGPAEAYAPYGASGGGYAPPVSPGRGVGRLRPRSVTAASLLLFGVAAIQPIVLILYYGIRLLIDFDAGIKELGDAGLTDLLGIAAIAIVIGVLGIMVARAVRAGPWVVWVLNVPVLGIALIGVLGAFLLLVDPTATSSVEAAGAAGYLVVVAAGLTGASVLLLNGKAREYFKKA